MFFFRVVALRSFEQKRKQPKQTNQNKQTKQTNKRNNKHQNKTVGNVSAPRANRAWTTLKRRKKKEADKSRGEM